MGNDPSLKRSCEQLSTKRGQSPIRLRSGFRYHHHHYHQPLAATTWNKRYEVPGAVCFNIAVFQYWFLISKKFSFALKGRMNTWPDFMMTFSIHVVDESMIPPLSKHIVKCQERSHVIFLIGAKHETWKNSIMIRRRVRNLHGSIDHTRDSNVPLNVISPLVYGPHSLFFKRSAGHTSSSGFSQ